MKILKITVGLIASMLACFGISKAQTIDFNKAPIAEVIQKIEATTAYRFNYNPNSIHSFSYSGQLFFGKMKAALAAIESQTPLQFEQQDSTILVILPKQKMKAICGYLFCENENTPLAFVNLYFKFSKTGITTDEQGFFKTEVNCYANEPIQISYVGYENKTVSINLFETTACPGIYLNPKEKMLNIGLVVKDYILPSVEEGKTNSSIGLNYKRMVEEENYLQSDVLQNVQILPGIISFDESATNISIRGNKPGHCITRWENIQLYNMGHFFGMMSSINPYVVEDVQVYKSSFHPGLGNTIGGVIDISLLDKITQKFDGGVGLDMTKAFGYFNIPLVKKKLSLSLSARHSIDDSFESPTLNSYATKVFQNTILDESDEKERFEERLDTEILFYDVQGKLNYQPNKKWSVNTSFFKSFDAFEYYGETKKDQFELGELISTNSLAAQTEVKFKPNKKHQFKFYGSYSSYEHSNEHYFKERDKIKPEEDDRAISYDEEEIGNKIESIDFGLNYQIKHHKYWTFDFSINSENKELFYNIKERSLFETEVFDKGDMGTAFFIHQDFYTTFANQKWTIDAGLRNTWYADLNELFFSPRANVQYKINEALKLKTSAGWHYQFISQLTKFNRYDIDNNPIWYLNAYEREEVLNAQKMSLGGIYKYKGWLIDVEAYLQKTNNLPGISTFINSDRPIDFFGEGFARGIDMMARKKWKTLTLWTNYTLSKNEITFSDISETAFPTSNDIRHNLTFNSSYTYKNWQASVNHHFRTSLPYTGMRSAIPKINHLRLPGFYSRLDAAISYRHSLFKNAIQFNGRLSILNLLNKENYESIEYRLVRDRNSIEPKPFENYLLGITPQLTFHFSW